MASRSRQKIMLACECVLEDRFISSEEANLAGNLEEFIPSQGRLQLIASGGRRPVGCVGQWTFVRQCKNGVDSLVSGEIGQHGATRGDGGLSKLGFVRDAPGGEQATYDDAGIKEVRQRARPVSIHGMFKRKRTNLSVPRSARQEACRMECRFEIFGLPQSQVEKQQGAYRIASDLVRDARVSPEVAAVISRHPAAGVLNSGVKKPASRRVQQVTRGPRQPIDHLLATEPIFLKDTFTLLTLWFKVNIRRQQRQNGCP